MLPSPIEHLGTPSKQGFISSINGPAAFSAHQVRKSDMTGENRGFVIFIRILDADFINVLTKSTITEISLNSQASTQNLAGIPLWSDPIEIDTIQPYSQILINDMNSTPVALLKMKHSIGSVPKLVNQQSSVFILLLSLCIYLFYQLVSFTIIKPIKKMAKDIKVIDESNKFGRVNESFTVQELVTVSQNVNELINTVQQQNELLEKQANTDQLTSLINRHGLLTALDKHKDLCVRQGIGFVVVMCDVDLFKHYNDSLGHLEGGKALFAVAQVLNDHCKSLGDDCARLGGEEFTLLFSDISEDNLTKKLTDIVTGMKELNLPHQSSNIAPYVTVSLGATIVKNTDVKDFTLPINEIIKSADNTLFQAKSNGRNGFKINHFSN